MTQLYVVCELEAASGRVLLGTLHGKKLQITEVREFPLVPRQEKKSVLWNFGQVYEEISEAFRTISTCEEPVAAITVLSSAGDFLALDKHGNLVPTPHPSDRDYTAMGEKVLRTLSPAALFERTGTRRCERNLFLQLGLDARRWKGGRVLPVADGLNSLLAGQIHVGTSMAAATHLMDIHTRQWSPEMLRELQIPGELLPPILEDGSVLGAVSSDLTKIPGFEDAQILASSHPLTAAISAAAACADAPWAFFAPGAVTRLGAVLPEPVLTPAARHLGFTHLPLPNRQVAFYSPTAGLDILDHCRHFWAQHDRSLDPELLSHLAGSATPFEVFIDPLDPQFRDPADMPLKIQAYCRETGQVMPRKPGSIYRCVLESLALHYRRLCSELTHLGGIKFEQVHLLGAGANGLLERFTANALQLPMLAAPRHASAIGCMLNQALAVGHLKTPQEQREVLKNSFKLERMHPHADIWDEPYQRFLILSSRAEVAAA